LMPQTASTEEAPPAPPAPLAPKVSVVQQDHTLEEFLADLKPNSNWVDEL